MHKECPLSLDNEIAQLPASARKVASALRGKGIEPRIVVTSDSARTAQQAAQALGIEVAQIAKSLVFRGTTSGRGILVVAAGDHRVSETKICALVGEQVERANARFVREATGFAIGGVPPIGHATDLHVLIDESLARFAIVWAAAGTPHCVFPIAPLELFRVVAGQVCDICAIEQAANERIQP